MKGGPYEKLRSEYFPYGTNNWLIRVSLYSHNKTLVESSEGCRKVFGRISGKSMDYRIKAIRIKIERKTFNRIFHEISGEFSAGSR